MSNHLVNEVSPYLLQHANNPVDWYPWGPEAFARAKRENKPVFLSIGYSTCHWCHVMAHESFEDPDVAKVMNSSFISIKVDREERPDIDMVYMKVCQMMTGSGGWPLTIIMTAEKEPFFAGTYIPKNTRYGQPGLLELIPRINEFWNTRRRELLNSADEIMDALQQTIPAFDAEPLTETALHIAFESFSQNFDEKHGGFGTKPKFPTPHNLMFLLRYWKRTGNERALKMVETTLQAMRRGGIYDQLGFGFHRYSTDAEWRVPHFEKMLYDQALITTAYVECYQATKREEYRQTATEILKYVLRDMTAPSGGFYSAEDADSEGQEGKFYLWKSAEIDSVLDKREASVAKSMFNISKEGNFHDEMNGGKSGPNILFIDKTKAEIANKAGISPAEFSASADSIRKKLFDYREKRIHPHKDDKILTDWNGLMIAALAKAAQAFAEPEFALAAERAADFILDNCRTVSGRLSHVYRPGRDGITGNADDYAFFIYGLLELYAALFDVRYLKAAIELNAHFIDHFWDRENGGFYFTAEDGEKLIVRQKEIYDGAIPSGNSIALWNLLRLSRITGNSDFEDKAAKMGLTFSNDVSGSPDGYSQFLVGLDFALGPAYELIIAGDMKTPATKKMLNLARAEFIPNKVVVFRAVNQESPEIDGVAPFVTNYQSIQGQTTAYVCRNFNCSLPTIDPGVMLNLLDVGK